MSARGFEVQDDMGEPFIYTCLTCGATVAQGSTKRHQDWHDALLHFTNTIAMESSLTELLEYSERL